MVAVSLAGAALAYLPLVLAGPGLPTALPSANVLGAVTVLALVCTATAFLLLFALVNEIGPVRATDRAGRVQDGRNAEPFPGPATGWHTISVNVRG